MNFFKVKPDYKPEEWKTEYRQKVNFADAIKIVQLCETCTDIEAEHIILDILCKATFVEKCLQYNGSQNVGDLFGLLQKIAEAAEQPSPFSSEQDLEEFLTKTDVLFIKHPRSKKYKNSGAGFRKFVQLLNQKLKLHERIDESTYENVLQQHYDSIQSVTGNEKFLKKEVLVEFQSLQFLPHQVSAFEYDMETGSLTLAKSETRNWVLQLPIFVRLISTGKLDASRTISGYFLMTTHTYPAVLNGYVTSPPFDGAVINFRSRLVAGLRNVNFHYTEMFFEGALVPDGVSSQIEAFRVLLLGQGVQDGLWAPQSAAYGPYKGTVESYTQKQELLTTLKNKRHLLQYSPEKMFVE